MAYFAELDEQGLVLRVISISNEVTGEGHGGYDEQLGVAYCQSLFGENTIWKQTSYNTRAGIYYIPNTGEPGPDQSKAFRKNYASIGWTYDATRDAFVNPKPTVSPDMEQYVVFNEFACLWEYSPPQATAPEIGVIRV